MSRPIINIYQQWKRVHNQMTLRIQYIWMLCVRCLGTHSFNVRVYICLALKSQKLFHIFRSFLKVHFRAICFI